MIQGENPIRERDRVYEYLTNQIINRKYLAGDMLNERQVAKEMAVSRTPVREAIHQLEAEGWVTVVPWKGIFIQEMTPKQVDEIFQIRLSLECLSVQLAAPTMTSEYIARLESLLEQQRELAPKYVSQDFIGLDIIFHNTIAVCSGNELLVQMLSALDRRLRRTGVLAVQDIDRYMRTLQEHQLILQALKEGSGQDAMRAMETHLNKTHESLIQQLTSITK